MWGKIVAFFVLKIYFQHRFELELENEVIDFVEELFPDWMVNRQVPIGWDVVGFFTLSFHFAIDKTDGYHVFSGKQSLRFEMTLKQD